MPSKTLLIVQLLIVLVVGLTVQSSPIKSEQLQKRQTAAKDTTEMEDIQIQLQKRFEKHLYCAAQSIYNTRAERLSVLDLPVPTAPHIDNDTKTFMSATFDLFSALCKNFTIAMCLKNQVQDLLFNTDTTPELSSDNIQKSFEILTNLQIMVTTFDDMQFSVNHSRCVRLTAAQYRIMYYIQYPSTSLKQALKDLGEDWYRNEKYYNHKDVRHSDNCPQIITS